MRSRAAGVAVLVAATTGLTATGALGWTAPGSGAGAVRARTLVAPTAVQASCSLLLPREVEVSWTGPASPLPGTDYVVARSADLGTTWTTVGTDAAPPFLVTDRPAAGTYRYRVTARAQQWSAVAATTPTRTILLTLVCA